MQQAAYKYETALFKLKSSATFWVIKRSQRTKIQKVINLERSQKKLWAKYGTLAVKLLRALYDESELELKMQSETKLDNSLKAMKQLWVDTNKHEDLNLLFVNHEKEDGTYPLATIEVATAQNWSILKRCKNIKSGFAFSTYWRHNSAI